jgi:peptide/nickel transport system permease protein
MTASTTELRPPPAATDTWRRRRGGAGLLGLLGRAARTRRGAVGLTLALLVVLVAAVGPIVKPGSPTVFVTTPFAAPGGSHLLGGDDLGRDVLSRVLSGGWLLLVMSLAATVVGVGLGVALGIVAAYSRGVVDGLVMRSSDVLLAFPQMVFALLLVSVVGPKLWLLVVAVAVVHAPQVARVVRAAALDVCERDFVRAVELWRAPRRRVIVGEILPNVTTVVMVEFGLRLTWSILLIASLSFIGFGLQPPSPNWGLMINENRTGLTVAPWPVVVPILLIGMLTIGVNTFTDAIARVSLGVERGASAIDVALVAPMEAEQ